MSRTSTRMVIMLALISAGETIFILPFVVARVFRPTLLDVFGLTNLQLGTATSLYGVVAMLSYFAGGPLADRFSARRLMTAALLATATGGAFFTTLPGQGPLTLLYGFWGLTTILLFWAALIRATREWGGSTSQGRAYGILDGGRGLVSALVASISVAIFAAALPNDAAQATLAQRSAALALIIWVYTGLVVAVAALVWFSIPETGTQTNERIPTGSWRGNGFAESYGCRVYGYKRRSSSAHTLATNARPISRSTPGTSSATTTWLPPGSEPSPTGSVHSLR